MIAGMLRAMLRMLRFVLFVYVTFMNGILGTHRLLFIVNIQIKTRMSTGYSMHRDHHTTSVNCHGKNVLVPSISLSRDPYTF